MKRCQACHQTKSLDEFKRNRKTPDGRTYVCKDCLRASRGPVIPNQTPEERRERILARLRERAVTDPHYKERQHAARRKTVYGLTAEQYDAILSIQDGACAICKQPPTATRGRGALHVDHCRDTETIRGLACFHCNTGLGHFNHDPALLCAAAEYLENPPVQIKRRTPQERDRAKCGTISGYMVHRRKGEPPCEACMAAKREYERQRRADEAVGRKRAKVAQCGTPSGYQRHRALGEQTCDLCKKAVAEYQAARRQKTSSQ